MKWYPFTLPQIGILIVLIGIADVFTIIQKYIFPEDVRPLTYVAFVILVLLAYFFIVRPGEPMALAGTLAVILGIVSLILILIQDVIIAYQISYRTIIVFLGAVIGPVIAGLLYSAMRTRAGVRKGRSQR
jgi:hypothetical protein